MQVPVVLVAGLAERPVRDVAEALLAPETVVVHHDLSQVREGVVRRRVRHGAHDHTETLELAHGCVSCTLREDLLPLVFRLASAPDVGRIVLHLDPALEPEALCWALAHVLVDGRTALDTVRVAATLTVVDAATWLHDASGDEELTDRGRTAGADDERTVAQVVVGQVEFADALVIAGAAPDTTTARRTDAVLDRLAPLAPRRRAAGLEVEALLAAVPAGSRRGAVDDAHAPLLRGEPPLHVSDGVACVLFDARRPFHPERLHDALDVLLDGVIRARGRLWIATQPDEALYLESAGAGLGIGHGGPWLAAVEDWSGVDPDRRAMAALRWHERYGDREQSLVVIAHEADPAAIQHALHGALLTDAELAADPSGWPDPFGEWHTDPCATSEHTAPRYGDERGHA